MSLTIGTILDYAIGPFKGKGTGESALLRSIFSCIKAGDILLGDRYYASFFILADILAANADGIFKAHIKREITIREFKVDGNIYITTLLDDKRYPKTELTKTYKLRWQVEINLKYVKEIMNMDMLSCKTPEMVIKEIGVHFLAYNFIRIMIAEACMQYDKIPYQISFKSTIQLLNKFMPYFINSQLSKIMYSELLRHIVTNKIGNRPGRLEPRKLKRRQKTYKLLNKPRIVEKARLMKQLEKRILRNAYA